MSRIEAYRDHAWKCLALAESLTSERERQALIEMAAVWHELAEARGKDTQSRHRDSFRPDGPRLYYDHLDGLEFFSQIWL
jgi:hypothetical protein